MADNWTAVPGYMKTITWADSLGGTIYLYLEYDADYKSAEWLRVRWKIGCGSNKLSGGNSWNHYFLLINPNNTAGYWSNRLLYPIKTTWTKNTSASYPYAGGEYWLSKGATATSYSVPEVWLCNDGYDNTKDNATDFYNAYKVGGGRGSALYRHYAVETVSNVPNIIAGPNNTGASVSISDNYNNTFNITCTLGSAGLNNTYNKSGCYLWWTQNKTGTNTWQWYNSSNTNGNRYTYGANETTKTVSNLALNITDASAATKQVAGCVTTASTYGSAVELCNTGYPSAGIQIKQYVAPTPSSTRPTLHYNKSRLTVRENWVFRWSAATKANDSSPVKGYEICITKNGSEIPITISSAGVISKSTGTGTRVFWEGSTREVSCDPANLGFVAGNTVRFWVRPYTKYGRNNDGEKLPSTWPDHTATLSATVQNAAVVHVYNTSIPDYEEGIVCVYRDGEWIEADSVHVYKDGNWPESN